MRIEDRSRRRRWSAAVRSEAARRSAWYLSEQFMYPTLHASPRSIFARRSCSRTCSCWQTSTPISMAPVFFTCTSACACARCMPAAYPNIKSRVPPAGSGASCSASPAPRARSHLFSAPLGRRRSGETAWLRPAPPSKTDVPTRSAGRRDSPNALHDALLSSLRAPPPSTIFALSFCLAQNGTTLAGFAPISFSEPTLLSTMHRERFFFGVITVQKPRARDVLDFCILW